PRAAAASAHVRVRAAVRSRCAFLGCGDDGFGHGVPGQGGQADHGCAAVDGGVRGQSQGTEPFQCAGDQFGFVSRGPGGLGPVRGVFVGEFADPGAQRLDGDGPSGGCQVFGEQQGGVAVCAVFGHAHVGEVVVGVDHGDALGTDLGDQAGEFGDPAGEGATLAGEVGALGVGERVVVKHGVVEQAAGEAVADRCVAQVVAVQV